MRLLQLEGNASAKTWEPRSKCVVLRCEERVQAEAAAEVQALSWDLASCLKNSKRPVWLDNVPGGGGETNKFPGQRCLRS